MNREEQPHAQAAASLRPAHVGMHVPEIPAGAAFTAADLAKQGLKWVEKAHGFPGSLVTSALSGLIDASTNTLVNKQRFSVLFKKATTVLAMAVYMNTREPFKAIFTDSNYKQFIDGSIDMIREILSFTTPFKKNHFVIQLISGGYADYSQKYDKYDKFLDDQFGILFNYAVTTKDRRAFEWIELWNNGCALDTQYPDEISDISNIALQQGGKKALEDPKNVKEALLKIRQRVKDVDVGSVEDDDATAQMVSSVVAMEAESGPYKQIRQVDLCIFWRAQYSRTAAVPWRKFWQDFPEKLPDNRANNNLRTRLKGLLVQERMTALEGAIEQQNSDTVSVFELKAAFRENVDLEVQIRRLLNISDNLAAEQAASPGSDSPVTAPASRASSDAGAAMPILPAAGSRAPEVVPAASAATGASQQRAGSVTPQSGTAGPTAPGTPAAEAATPQPAASEDGRPHHQALDALFGREDDINALRGSLGNMSLSAVFLTGVTGVGKSLLARRVAEDLLHGAASDFKGLLWVPLATTKCSMEVGNKIASVFRAKEEKPKTRYDEQELLQLLKAGIRRRLNDGAPNKKLLIVLDDADSALHDVEGAQLLARIFDELVADAELIRGIKIILTSREAPQLPPTIKGIKEQKLGPISQDAACDMLEALLDHPELSSVEQQYLSQLAGVCNNMPYMLKLVGQALRTGRYTAKDILRKHGSKASLLAILFEALTHLEQVALIQLSVFPGAFSVEDALTILEAPTLGDVACLLNRLERQGLVIDHKRTDASTWIYSPSLRRYTIWESIRNNVAESAGRLGEDIIQGSLQLDNTSNALDGGMSKQLGRSLGRMLISSAEERFVAYMLQDLEDYAALNDVEASNVMLTENQAGLRLMAKLLDVKDDLSSAKRWTESWGNSNGRITYDKVFQLAKFLNEKSYFQVAEKLFAVVNILRTLESEENKRKATEVKFGHASCLYEQGRYKEAQKICEEVLAQYESDDRAPLQKTSKDRKEDLAILMRAKFSLAMCLKALGRFKDAELLYNEVIQSYLGDLDERYGQNHIDTARAYDALGNCLRSQGKYEDALDNHYKALRIREFLLDRNDEAIGRSHNNLGVCYREKGEYAKAKECFLRARDIWDKGPNKSDKALAKLNLATIEGLLGNYDDSVLQLYDDAVKLFVEHVGEAQRHPLVADAKYYKALHLCRIGKPENLRVASVLLDEVASTRGALLGQENFETALAMLAQGFCSTMQGLYGVAEAQLKRGIHMLMDALGGDHPFLSRAWIQLADCLRLQGQVSAASRHYMKVIDSYQAGKAGARCKLEVFAVAVAAAGPAEGEPTAAVESGDAAGGKDAAEVPHKAHGSYSRLNHPDLAAAKQGLAECYMAEKNFKSAVDTFEEVINMREKSLGVMHPDTVAARKRHYDALAEAHKALAAALPQAPQ